MSMRERPILFSGPMVRAILEGRKTVTRRVVKDIPWLPGVNEKFSQARSFSNDGLFHIAGSLEMTKGFRCPYGKPGDRLWVRETTFRNPHPSEIGLTRADIPSTWDGACEAAGKVIYRADLEEADAVAAIDGRRWRSSIHMPRAWARIWLEIAAVRVERLCHISEGEARSEGLEWNDECLSPIKARDGFARLWDGLSKPDTSWAANPWVWVVEFKRVEVPDGGG